MANLSKRILATEDHPTVCRADIGRLMAGRAVDSTASQDPQVSMTVKCSAVEQPDGSIHVSFVIHPMASKRLRSRAQKIPLSQYIWDNFLKSAIDSALY